SLALRLTSSPRQGFARGIAPPGACRATCRTGNLQGELLSVHQISQAYPGTPEQGKLRPTLRYHLIRAGPPAKRDPGCALSRRPRSPRPPCSREVLAVPARARHGPAGCGPAQTPPVDQCRFGHPLRPAPRNQTPAHCALRAGQRCAESPPASLSAVPLDSWPVSFACLGWGLTQTNALRQTGTHSSNVRQQAWQEGFHLLFLFLDKSQN